MVGSCAPLRQGWRSTGAALALAAALLAPVASADRSDQKAADLYSEGVRLIRAGRYREGAAKINAALARGATEPVEAQGSETRFLARPYDPYYWLGVAQMETGLREQALSNLEKSSTMVPKGRTQPVLADAPAEWADLQRRKALLLAELETPTPVAVAVATVAPPTPTPFVLRLPERTPLPAPTEAPAVAERPRPTPPPAPSPAALPATALALREDLVALLAEPAVALAAGEGLRGRVARLDAALGRGAKEAAAAEREARRALAGAEGGPLLRAALEAGLEAQRGRRYEDAARLAGVASRLVPAAPQPHLLRAVALGTLWLLRGEEGSAWEGEARGAFRAWVALRPAGAPPPAFLSPALRERLERPRPTPGRA